MKRWHQDFTVSKRQWKRHRRMHVDSNKNYSIGFQAQRVGVSAYEVDCECDDQIGRFRKKDAYDCGHTQCFMCHGDKFPKREPTEQEMISEMSFREQLMEMAEKTEEKRG